MSSPHGPRAAWLPPFWLILVTLVCLLPFINKAVFIDDTLFLRAAEQIRHNPADFYGATINWFGAPGPLYVVFDNPPLTSCYIALLSFIAVWSEPALHLGFLLPALAAVWGIYLLARHFTDRPALAAVVALFTPAFLISATTLMSDVPLLALWVWTLVLFEHGLQTNRSAAFVFAGLLAGLGVLTKFTALAMVPLLAAFALTHKRRAGWWLIAIVIPALFAAGYGLLTRRLYGQDLLFAAGQYAARIKGNSGLSLIDRTSVGLGFLGGCFLPVMFYVPLAGSRRFLLAGLGLSLLSLPMLPHVGPFSPLLHREDHSFNWGLLVQCWLFVLAGFEILLLTIADLWERRDRASLLLALWIGGIVVFAIGLNWTINGRSFLPMAPAVGILVARRIGARRQSARAALAMWQALAALAACVPLLVVDYRSANADRRAAEQIISHHARPGRTIWFEGHWGLQYYFEKLGAKAVNLQSTHLASGDLLVIPTEMTNVYDPPWNSVRLLDTIELLPSPFLATMNSTIGAGFYAAVFGPLPFVAGKVEPYRFYIFEVK